MEYKYGMKMEYNGKWNIKKILKQEKDSFIYE